MFEERIQKNYNKLKEKMEQGHTCNIENLSTEEVLFYGLKIISLTENKVIFELSNGNLVEHSLENITSIV